MLPMSRNIAKWKFPQKWDNVLEGSDLYFWIFCVFAFHSITFSKICFSSVGWRFFLVVSIYIYICVSVWEKNPTQNHDFHQLKIIYISELCALNEGIWLIKVWEAIFVMGTLMYNICTKIWCWVPNTPKMLFSFTWIYPDQV